MSLIVKINGVASHVSTFIDPEQVAEDSQTLMDWLNGVADKFVAAEFKFIVSPFLESLKSGILGLISMLNHHSAEIITLGTISTAIGMMVAPLMGSSSARWFGRLVAVILLGSIWRLLT